MKATCNYVLKAKKMQKNLNKKQKKKSDLKKRERASSRLKTKIYQRPCEIFK